jgi:hypothetical protein
MYIILMTRLEKNDDLHGPLCACHLSTPTPTYQHDAHFLHLIKIITTTNNNFISYKDL